MSAADILQLSGLPAALQNSSNGRGGEAAESSRKKKKRRRRTKGCSENGSEEAAVAAEQSAQTGDRAEAPWHLGGPGGSVAGEDSDGPSRKAVMVKKKKKEMEARTG